MWEYKALYLAALNTIGVAQMLTDAGEWGWELVSVDDKVAYFKRPKKG